MPKATIDPNSFREHTRQLQQAQIDWLLDGGKLRKRWEKLRRVFGFTGTWNKAAIIKKSSSAPVKKV